MLDGFVAAHRDLVRLAAPRVVVPNFGLAAEMAIAEGIEVREVQVTDDVASASSAEMSGRRGIAGDIYVFECIGAAAERGASLDEVERVARKANAATLSIGRGRGK